MKLFINTLAILLVSVAQTFGQQYVGGTAANGSEMNTVPLGAVQEVDMRDFNPAIEHFYLHDTWGDGIIYVQGGHIIKGYPLKVDLLNGLLEIKTKDQIKVLKNARVDSFEIYTPLGNYAEYVTAVVKQSTKTPVAGLFRIVKRGGKWSLFERNSVKIIPPNYNKALDAGTQEERIVQMNEYFFFEGNLLINADLNKKKFIETFHKEYQENLKVYIKKHNLNVKKEKDLLKILDFLNHN